MVPALSQETPQPAARTRARPASADDGSRLMCRSETSMKSRSRLTAWAYTSARSFGTARPSVVGSALTNSDCDGFSLPPRAPRYAAACATWSNSVESPAAPAALNSAPGLLRSPAGPRANASNPTDSPVSSRMIGWNSAVTSRFSTTCSIVMDGGDGGTATDGVATCSGVSGRGSASSLPRRYSATINRSLLSAGVPSVVSATGRVG
ncbi:MAG: hypothetical protein AUI10_03155 [Actinobacteria bacterium 13_2_20CM_2_72_6]|nr:MAG: hypothetical protein AUI10_03155 [Actinobacteria bacterium 13_2_20CM_2_72_6]